MSFPLTVLLPLAMAPLLIFTYPERPWIAQSFLALGFFDFIVYQLFGHRRNKREAQKKEYNKENGYTADKVPPKIAIPGPDEGGPKLDKYFKAEVRK